MPGSSRTKISELAEREPERLIVSELALPRVTSPRSVVDPSTLRVLSQSTPRVNLAPCEAVNWPVAVIMSAAALPSVTLSLK